MHSNQVLATKNNDELVQVIENRLDELMVILFIGNCCLLDMSPSEKAKFLDKYAETSATSIFQKSLEKKYLPDIKHMIKAGLEKKPNIDFEAIIKSFLRKHVQTNLSSLTFPLLRIIEIIDDLKNQDYKFNRVILKQCERILAKQDKKQHTNEEIFNHIHQRKKENIPAAVTRYILAHETFKSIFTWAENEDRGIEAVVQDSAKAITSHQKSFSDYIIPFSENVIIFGGISMITKILLDHLRSENNAVPADPELEEQPEKNESERIIRAVLMGLGSFVVIAIAAYLVRTSVFNKLFSHEIKTRVNTYKGEDDKINHSFILALRNFFNIRLTDIQLAPKQETANQPNHNKPVTAPHYTVTLTPQNNDNYNNNNNDSNISKIEVAPKVKKLRKAKTKTRLTFTHAATEANQDQKNNLIVKDTYEYTTTHLLRKMEHGKVQRTMVLGWETVNEIKDNLLTKIALRRFKTDEPTMLNKVQSEIRLPGYDERLFGATKIVKEKDNERIYNQKESLNDKQVIEYTKFLNSPFH